MAKLGYVGRDIKSARAKGLDLGFPWGEKGHRQVLGEKTAWPLQPSETIPLAAEKE